MIGEELRQTGLNWEHWDHSLQPRPSPPKTRRSPSPTWEKPLYSPPPPHDGRGGKGEGAWPDRPRPPLEALRLVRVMRGGGTLCFDWPRPALGGGVIAVTQKAPPSRGAEPRRARGGGRGHAGAANGRRRRGRGQGGAPPPSRGWSSRSAAGPRRGRTWGGENWEKLTKIGGIQPKIQGTGHGKAEPAGFYPKSAEIRSKIRAKTPQNGQKAPQNCVRTPN